VQVEQLALRDFRSYVEVDVALSSGLVAVTGANGQGKTNLLEAIGYLATLRSLRGVSPDVMVRHGADSAVVRGMAHRGARELLIECELGGRGRSRVQVNRQRLARRRDLLGLLLVSVFTPDDLELVKGGPAGRREFLDDLLVSRNVANDQLRDDLDKVLRQRNALLKGVRGRLDASAEATLDVWDAKLTSLGERWAELRAETLDELRPTLQEAYRRLSGTLDELEATYRPPWRQSGLAEALAEARSTDVRRGLTTVGPHRDEMELILAGMAARNRASQGEQRTVALSLRLAAHQHLTDLHDSSPILLLDDVFSELDPGRSAALLQSLPVGQVFISTAGPLPDGADPDQTISVTDGRLASNGASASHSFGTN
jgi:DNA replication and repair protein RecF